MPLSLRILSDQQCGELTEASLECLERIGVEVGNAEARDLLARAGASVDGTRLRIPATIIRAAIESTPTSFIVYGRTGEQPMEVKAGGPSHFGPGLTATYFVDPETGQGRPSRRSDPPLTARVADACGDGGDTPRTEHPRIPAAAISRELQVAGDLFHQPAT